MRGMKESGLAVAMRGLIMMTLLVYFADSATAQPNQVRDCPLGRPTNKQEFLDYLKSDDTDTHLKNLIDKCGIDFPVDEEILLQVSRKPQLVATLKILKSIKDRAIVTLFQYSASDNCTNFPKQLEQFREMLHSKLIIISGMFKPRYKEYDYIGLLDIAATGIEKPNLNQLEEFWKRPQVLQILFGRCFGHDKEASIESKVFLGDRAGPLKISIVPVTINPIETEFRHNRDIHSLLILYTLAQDAIANDRRRELILDFLREARDIAEALAKTDHAEEIKPIQAAIKDTYRELHADDLWQSKP